MSQDDLLTVGFDIDEGSESAFLRVGEKRYELDFDMEAIYVFYKLSGINPIIEPMGADPSRAMAFLWCGLRRHNPELSFDTVRSWFSPSTFVSLCEGTFKAFELALPKKKKNGGDGNSDPSKA